MEMHVSLNSNCDSPSFMSIILIAIIQLALNFKGILSLKLVCKWLIVNNATFEYFSNSVNFLNTLINKNF